MRGMTSPVRALWDAPAAVPPPPRRVWRDWVLVGVLAPLAFVEAALRPEVPHRWLWAVVLAALVPALLWRRTHPLAALAGAYAVGAVVGLVTGGDPELYVTAAFLILLYAVMRWGSGRAIIIGAALVLIGWATSFVTGSPTPGDAIGGLAVVALTSSLGFAFRWRAASRARELDEVRLRERVQLARDLHDTVAHHVSAIAIQAQAGTAVAGTDPDAAARVLVAIEQEAGRTLDEMRSMVGLLRGDGAVELAPTPDLTALDTLTDASTPTVHVQVVGDPRAVAPAAAAAVFRIAQEAVTNARRHAIGATRVDVTVEIGGVDADAGTVRLTVRDDGEPAASVAPGFGITGMTERATLLGGTCTAAPGERGGWVVTARIPRGAR